MTRSHLSRRTFATVLTCFASLIPLNVMIGALVLSAQTHQASESGVAGAVGQPAPCTYRLHGSVELNDNSADCTPGVVRTTDLWGPEGICSTSTKNYRHTTAEMKKQVCDEYGVTPCPHGGTLEIDHLLPLEIGGADDVKNLWPQQATPKPGFHEKDRLENFVHAEICSGNLDVAIAQKRMAEDWYQLYLDFNCTKFCGFTDSITYIK